MSAALRTLARAARGAGCLEGDDVVRGRAEHPVCGDEIELDLRIEDGRIRELAWRARGCPATLAVAACLTEAWTGAETSRAGEHLRGVIALHGGLAAHEQHAVTLALTALSGRRG